MKLNSRNTLKLTRKSDVLWSAFRHLYGPVITVLMTGNIPASFPVMIRRNPGDIYVTTSIAPGYRRVSSNISRTLTLLIVVLCTFNFLKSEFLLWLV